MRRPSPNVAGAPGAPTGARPAGWSSGVSGVRDDRGRSGEIRHPSAHVGTKEINNQPIDGGARPCVVGTDGEDVEMTVDTEFERLGPGRLCAGGSRGEHTAGDGDGR